MKSIKNSPVVLLALSILIWSAVQLIKPSEKALAQSSSGISSVVFATALSGCTVPPGIGTNPTGGVICVYPGSLAVATASAGAWSAFTAITAAAALPPTLTTTAGICVTGYNQSTNAWVTSPCANTVNTMSGAVVITANTTLSQ